MGAPSLAWVQASWARGLCLGNAFPTSSLQRWTGEGVDLQAQASSCAALIDWGEIQGCFAGL